MGTRVWPAGLEAAEAELLEGSELGFLGAGPEGFIFIPCPWAKLKGVPTGPYLARSDALAAVRRQIALDPPGEERGT